MAKAYRGPMMLVGFGDVDLIDAIKLIGTDREDELLELPIKKIPRSRRPTICTMEEVGAYTTYINWLSEKFKIDLETGESTED